MQDSRRGNDERGLKRERLRVGETGVVKMFFIMFKPLPILDTLHLMASCISKFLYISVMAKYGNNIQISVRMYQAICHNVNETMATRYLLYAELAPGFSSYRNVGVGLNLLLGSFELGLCLVFGWVRCRFLNRAWDVWEFN